MIPSLIFDLDGTLVDSLPGIAASLNRTLAAHGYAQHPLEAVRAYVGDGLRTLIERAAPQADPPTIDALVATYKEDYAHHWMEGTQPYPAIPHLLKELLRGGHQLAVLSNKTHDFSRSICRELFPLIHFTLVLGQQAGMPLKPHPSGAFKIANALGRNPKDCIFIGDSVADVQTARNADMHCIAVTWGYHDSKQLIAAGASKLVDNPAALARVIREMSER